MGQLKECPFCGGREINDGIIHHKPNCYIVLCTIQTFAPISYSQDKLIKSWNTRAKEQTMTTNEERKQVAARLRELDIHKWYDSADEIDSLETAIGCSIGQDWQDKNWWNRLADLIDIEERTTTRHSKFKTKYGNKVPLCECCDYSIGDKRYNFCPNCGAKIEERR